MSLLASTAALLAQLQSQQDPGSSHAGRALEENFITTVRELKHPPRDAQATGPAATGEQREHDSDQTLNESVWAYYLGAVQLEIEQESRRGTTRAAVAAMTVLGGCVSLAFLACLLPWPLMVPFEALVLAIAIVSTLRLLRRPPPVADRSDKS